MSLLEIFLFGNPGYCRILHQDSWLMQMDLCFDLELSIGNYLSFFPLMFGPNEKKVCLTRIKLQF